MTAPNAPRTAPVQGLGIDAVDVARFRTVLGRRPQMAGRMFSDGERAYAAPLKDPVPHLAARFAAKEAVLKAMGVGFGAAPLNEIEVVRADSGAPSLALGPSAQKLADERGITAWHLSLTHTDVLAMAAVVAEGAGTSP